MSIVTSGPAVSSRALGVLLDSWRASSAPGYAALADRIRLLVLDGRLSVGTRLPSERDLAAHLGVSRTTVAAAYAALRDAGHVTSLRGSGSVVRLPDQARTVRAARPAAEDDVLDFTKAAMPAVDGIAEAAQRAAGRLGAYLSEPGYDTVGRPVLREAIAARYRARGLETSADQIVVTLGAQHAIALLARVLVGRGDRAVVETPGYPHAFEALRAAGARLAPVSVTVDEGWDESALLQTLRRTSPPVAYLMPDFHNPTGATMPEAQRVRVLEAAADEGTTVIADETMAELVVGGPRGASFAGAAGAAAAAGAGARPLPMAAYGPAVTIGSVGKSLWGGLRIGWIRAERPLVERLVRARSAGDLGTPVLEQLIVADLLGDMDGVLEARARQLRHGRDRLVAGLRSAFPGWSVPSPAGGLTTWVGLGAPVSSQLVLAARRHGLLLAAGPMFGVDGAFERFLRVPYSYPDEETDRALAALAAAWDGIDGVQAPRGALMAEVV
jgi:DNA-binding transcriptional MocR family regulator